MPADAIGALLEFLYLTPVGVVKFRPDGTIEMANPMAAQLLMPLASDGTMTNLYRVLSNVLPDLRDHIVRFQQPCGQLWDQMRLAVPGTRTVLTLSINKIDPDTFMAVIQDISRTIEQEIRIRDDQQRFRAIFENIRDYAIYTVDSFGRIDGWNRTLGRIGGWEEADVNGSPISISFPAELEAESTGLLDRARKFGVAEFEGWRVRRDGSRFWGNTVATALPDADGGVSGYVLVTRDQTERKRMEDRLVALSTTDSLTGAFNRRAGDTKLEEAYRDWRRDGRVFSLLMIDCDHFKNINDRWGHDKGDEVLIALVRICKEKLRDLDAVFRWGGEEFLVLLPGANGKIALDVGERLRLAIAAASIGLDERQTRMTVSIGVVEVTEFDTSADDAVRRVDRALYQGKAAGRNRVVAG